MKITLKKSLCAFVVGTYFLFAPIATMAAEEHDHQGHEDEHADHEDHDHSEHEYLYGNHYCPACNYADPVDPHFYADISNKKAGVYARIYVCSKGCIDKIKKDVGKYYMDVYRTDRKTEKEKPALDLKNKVCPMSGEAVDGKTSIEYNGMMVHFCCEDCSEAFVKDPEPGMRKLLPEAKEYKFEGSSEHEDHDHDHEGHDHDHENEDHK